MLIEVAKANELTLDWLVAKCQGVDAAISGVYENGTRSIVTYYHESEFTEGLDGRSYCPSSHASDGYEILDKAGIICGPSPFVGSNYAAAIGCNLENGEFIQVGNTRLVAAMRTYIVSCLGSKVEIPEELVN